MRNDVNHRVGPTLWPVAFVAVLLTAALALRAQPMAFGRVKDFSVPDFYPPPHENQMRSLLSGTEALPQPGGVFVIRNARLESFREDGQREAVISAPECVYDTSAGTASSAGPLRMESSDGRLVIEGVGFLWRQTNAVLVISNQTRTTLRGTPVSTPSTNR